MTKNKMIEIGLDQLRSAVNSTSYTYDKKTLENVYHKAIGQIELLYDMEIIESEQYEEALEELKENYESNPAYRI